MHAFYMSLEKPTASHTWNTFRIWRSRNHNVDDSDESTDGVSCTAENTRVARTRMLTKEKI